LVKDLRLIIRSLVVTRPHDDRESRQEELLPTRRSLLGRLRNWEDQASWREFFDTYWKFIYSMAVRSGLSDQEAEDVVQETVTSVARKMPEFRYDPERCSFKGWLMHVTRLRIVDQLRRRQPAFSQQSLSDHDTRQTPTVERVPDPAAAAPFEEAWDQEWERNLVDAAMERVKLRVKPEHYQIFYLSAVKGLGTGEVARMLQVNVGQVYLVRHRIAKEVKREVERLRERPL
jgi:RNA polymerase sigma factor (sigma-70 family)